MSPRPPMPAALPASPARLPACPPARRPLPTLSPALSPGHGGHRGLGDATCRLHSRPWSAFTVSCMAAAAASIQADTHPSAPCRAPPPRACAGTAPPPPEAARGRARRPGPASGPALPRGSWRRSPFGVPLPPRPGTAPGGKPARCDRAGGSARTGRTELGLVGSVESWGWGGGRARARSPRPAPRAAWLAPREQPRE